MQAQELIPIYMKGITNRFVEEMYTDFLKLKYPGKEREHVEKVLQEFGQATLNELNRAISRNKGVFDIGEIEKHRKALQTAGNLQLQFLFPPKKEDEHGQQ